MTTAPGFLIFGALLTLIGCTDSQEGSTVGSKDDKAAAATKTLCVVTPLAPNVDDLRFSEAEFTAAQFDSSYHYFEDKLSRKLDSAEKTEELTEREGFWIEYGNRLRIMKGYMLKQAALLEQAGRPTDTALGSDSTSATFRFCHFLTTERHVD